MKKITIVIDMQNDFLTGSLVTPDVLKETNPTVYEAIRQKEMKNAFKLKPMPSYNPNI